MVVLPMRKTEKEEVLHIMKNIATKFKGVESMYKNQKNLHDAQTHMIHSINKDWDRVWELLGRE